MSNQKITELSSLSQNDLDPANDLLLAVDVSNTSMSSGGTNVKITPKALVGPSLSDLIQTWNNGGTIFSGLKLNVTDTASDANSSLLDFQIGSSSRFKITKGGMGFLNNGGVGKGGLTFQDSIESIGVIEFFNSGDNTNSRGLVIRPLVSYTGERAAADGWVSMRFGVSNNQIFFGHTGSASLIQSGFSGKLFLRANGSTTPNPTGASHISILNGGNVGIGTDAPTTRLDIAGNVDVKNSTTATSLTLYGTYTDASNYRRLYVSSTTAGVFTLGVEGAGTGASGNLLQVNANPSGTDARVIDIQRNGSHNFSVGLDYSYDQYFGDRSGISFGRALYGSGYIGLSRSYQIHLWNNLGVQLRQGLYLGFGGSTFDQVNAGFDSADARIYRDAADTLALRRSTNSQTFRIYNAFTDASNYDRGFMRWNANVFEIGTERAGTYTTTRTVSISSGSMIFTLNGQSNGWGVYYSSFPILSGGTGSASFAAGIPVTINNRMNFVEIATPATPAANTCTIYAKDNGAGKTQLVVLMPDGVETILATQT